MNLISVKNTPEKFFFGAENASGENLPNPECTMEEFEIISEIVSNVLEEAQYTDGMTENFSYDKAGNILSKKTEYAKAEPILTDYLYNQANQLMKMGGTAFSYDLSGNLIEKDDAGKKSLFSYDTENRLIKAVSPEGNILENVYCPFGKRIMKKETLNDPAAKIKTLTTQYFYDNEDILMTFDGEGKPKDRFLHGQGIDEPIGILTNDGRRYLHSNSLGSITAVTDSTGKILERNYYRAYGEQTTSHWDTDRLNSGNSTGIPAKAAEDIFNPYGFTGRENDGNGLMYYRNRHYMPSTGRFMQEDVFPKKLIQNKAYMGKTGGSIGNYSCSSCERGWGGVAYEMYANGEMLYSADLANYYAYVAGNPVNGIDPFGYYGDLFGGLNYLNGKYGITFPQFNVFTNLFYDANNAAISASTNAAYAMHRTYVGTGNLLKALNNSPGAKATIYGSSFVFTLASAMHPVGIILKIAFVLNSSALGLSVYDDLMTTGYPSLMTMMQFFTGAIGKGLKYIPKSALKQLGIGKNCVNDIKDFNELFEYTLQYLETAYYFGDYQNSLNSNDDNKNNRKLEYRNVSDFDYLNKQKYKNRLQY